MTYEEVREITRRLESLDKLTVDVRLDSRNMSEQPEFYYYEVQVGLSEENKTITVVKLRISEDPESDEIHLCKCNYDYIYIHQRQDQKKIYDICKEIVRDYLNGTLMKEG